MRRSLAGLILLAGCHSTALPVVVADSVDCIAREMSCDSLFGVAAGNLQIEWKQKGYSVVLVTQQFNEELKVPASAITAIVTNGSSLCDLTGTIDVEWPDDSNYWTASENMRCDDNATAFYGFSSRLIINGGNFKK